MLTSCFHRFIRDERGSYTLWSLVWFILYVVIGGLAVDGTDAFRNQVLLQATADASALAGAMSLYESGEDPVYTALDYAAVNMPPEVHGTVLAGRDVHVGIWNFDLETFLEVPYDAGDPNETANAVYVITRRGEDNGNPVIMSFLRILQLWGFEPWWNIYTEAVAVQYVPDCLIKNGLVAWNKVDVTSNNGFDDICVHGQNAIEDPGHDYAIDIQNNGSIGPDTRISMPDLEDMNGRPNVYDNNPGLYEAMAQGSLPAYDALSVNDIISGYEDGTHMPTYMYQEDVDINGDPILVGPQVVTVANAESFAGPYEPYHVYDMNCSSSANRVTLPNTQVIENVVIVADCRISAQASVALRSAVVATSATGNGTDPLSQHSVNFPSDAQIGGSEFCDDSSGQVHIYSAASIHIAAGPDVYGLRMVAGGDIHFTANGNVYGISAEAGNDITATANGEFAFCGGEFEGPFAWHYRLVR